MTEQDIVALIAENLRAIRAKRGWSQSQAAEAVGVERQSYIAWENRQKSPSLASLAAIATAFNCPVGRLFRG